MMAAFIIFRARMMTRFSASLLTRNDRSSIVLWFFYFAQRVASAALAGAVGRTRFFVVIFVTALVGAGISAKGWLYQRVDGLIDLTTINRRRPADYSSRRGSE